MRYKEAAPTGHGKLVHVR